MCSLEVVKDKLEKSNQTHLLNFYGNLTEEQQQCLLEQLNTIDFNNAKKVFEEAMCYLEEDVKKVDERIKPIPPDQFESETRVRPEILEEYRKTGLKVIADNQVAVLLLAGGQGTRLGVTYPKGMFPIDLPSGKTLYQIQAERIRRVAKIARDKHSKHGRIFWYIMTSEATHSASKKYLENHGYFGLNKKDVILFKQSLLPTFTFDGKIILEEKCRVSLSPDGNGGLYKALKKNDILVDMKKRGVKYVHIHSVDNILIKVADPVFIGYCVKKDADCGTKVIKKNTPSEPLGVICQLDDTFQVVEYSEISEVTANMRDERGDLIFRAGNICNHFFTTEFLENISYNHEHELKLHVARKKTPYIDDQGHKIIPTAPNCIKIEKFIFDVFPLAKHFVTWEVPRAVEFSPLKNCESVSKDCPSTVRRDLLNLHKNYVEKAGGVVQNDVEISPILSYAGENLVHKVKGRIFDSKTVILSDEEMSNGF